MKYRTLGLQSLLFVVAAVAVAAAFSLAVSLVFVFRCGCACAYATDFARVNCVYKRLSTLTYSSWFY